MPVTVKVADREAAALKAESLGRYAVKSSQDMLKAVGREVNKETGPIFQTSLSESYLSNKIIHEQKNGLVQTALQAYSSHLHLILRPEDIWLAVLTQFSFYVNAHAEELRRSFVPHEGKKGLILEQGFPDGNIDVGLMAYNMTRLIEQNIVDPNLRAWVLPAFTTTEPTDLIIASAVMMSTLQKYFDYIFATTCCGIPTVTLLGEQSDWEEILDRIEKLAEYGEEPKRFLTLLRPICRNLVATFSAPPDDPSVTDFWSRIVRHDRGSGINRINGWLAAFCFWDNDGKMLARESQLEQRTQLRQVGRLDNVYWLDDAIYHHVDMEDIPCGWATVPVSLVIDDGPVVKTMMLAGSVGMEYSTAKTPYWKIATTTETLAADSEEKIIASDTTVKDSVEGSEPLELQSVSTEVRRRLSVHEERASSHDKTDETRPSVPSQDLEAHKQSNPGVAPNTGASAPINTIWPVSGWWMYKVEDDSEPEMTKDEYLEKMLAERWTGSATGHVYPNGSMWTRQN